MLKPLYRLAQRLCASELIADVYRGILGREPDRESDAYVRQLGSSRNLAHVVADISSSHEAWERNLHARPDELLLLIFRGLCAQQPDADLHASFAAQLAQSRDLPATLARFLQSRELWAAIVRSSPDRIVESACRSLLRSEPEAQA